MRRKQSLFQEVPIERRPRNYFDLSHEVKGSGKFGYAYPILCQETIPGGTVSVNPLILTRFAPMLAPPMHRFTCKWRSFYVPYRLISDIYEDFFTGGQDGTDAPVMPFWTPKGQQDEGDATLECLQAGSLLNWLGMPRCDMATISTTPIVENLTPFPIKVYFKIWNDYLRDPNFDEEMDLRTNADGNCDPWVFEALNVALHKGGLRSVGWRKDYFTSALENPQRGDEVLIPMAGIGAVTYLDTSVIKDNTGGLATPGGVVIDAASRFAESVSGQELRVENINTVTVSNTSFTINDLRVALATQSWAEAQARGGARYNETHISQFAVDIEDYRVQRAEFLGGGNVDIQISQVVAQAQTNDTEGGIDVPLGDLAGHGVAVGKGGGFSYYCREFGMVMTIMYVTVDTAYMQGIERFWWNRFSHFDLPWSQFAHLGEQAILSKEIYFSYENGNKAANDATFGYTPRNAEWKFRLDRVVGDFTTTLAYWHEARMFKTRPVLDSLFTTINELDTTTQESMRRIFAVQSDTDYLWFDIFLKVGAQWPLPYFGVPKLIG